MYKIIELIGKEYEKDYRLQYKIDHNNTVRIGKTVNGINSEVTLLPDEIETLIINLFNSAMEE